MGSPGCCDTALERAIIRDFKPACHAARGRHAMMQRHSRLLAATQLPSSVAKEAIAVLRASREAQPAHSFASDGSMIRRFFARLIPGKASSKPLIYGPDAHPIRRSHISRGANDVIRKLQQAGFRPSTVGGAVRDLLLGITPKDFDLAPDATPEQVKPLFRRAFIIGRRFRLVHVLAGPETIEVATFRSLQTGDDAADEHGRLLSDNVFGSQAQDALRRDFTINALYFDPSTEQVWDYVGGVADVKARRLRLIGDPVTRYREDPVRMLRGARLAAKLGITIEKKTAAPIPELAPLLENVPPARLFDEMEKLLLSGHAVESLKSLRLHGLHHGVLPLLDVILEQPLGQRFIELVLANTDASIRALAPATISCGCAAPAAKWKASLPRLPSGGIASSTPTWKSARTCCGPRRRRKSASVHAGASARRAMRAARLAQPVRQAMTPIANTEAPARTASN